jgi:hypothetical protein
MPMCNKCLGMFPPNFTDKLGEKEYLCVFCQRSVDEIRYGDNKKATRKEIIKDYDIYLKMVKEKSEILKQGMRGENVIPDNLIDFRKG